MTRRRSLRPKSAADLMAELNSDAKYVARARQYEQRQRQEVERYAKASEPVLRDLAAVGYGVRTIGGLRDHDDYRRAIPVLLRWLPQISEVRVKQDIVRSLSVPWAKPAASSVLIDEFRKAEERPDTGLRWAIASALEVVADDDVSEAIIELVRNKAYGKAREMLALSLGNMNAARTVPVLRELLDDEEVAGHAVMALGRLGAAEARQDVERFLTHPATWVRREAKKALNSIDRKAGR